MGTLLCETPGRIGLTTLINDHKFASVMVLESPSIFRLSISAQWGCNVCENLVARTTPVTISRLPPVHFPGQIAFWEKSTLVIERCGPQGRFREERYIDEQDQLHFKLTGLEALRKSGRKLGGKQLIF